MVRAPNGRSRAVRAFDSSFWSPLRDPCAGPASALRRPRAPRGSSPRPAPAGPGSRPRTSRGSRRRARGRPSPPPPPRPPAGR